MRRQVAWLTVALAALGCDGAGVSVQRSSVEVSITRGEVELHGTLELPDADHRVPAVLMIQGSAAFDRSNLRLFDTLAHRLADAGFASLRVDDRGVGRSGGVKHDLSSSDLAEDVAALHSFLVSRRETDPRRVGLLGHSFGGALAPWVASRSTTVAFVVTLAGYAVTGEELMINGRRWLESRRDTEASQVHRILMLQHSIFDAARTSGPWEPVEQELRALHRSAFDAMDEPSRSRFAGFDAYVASTADNAVLELAKTPWFESFLVLDPRPAIRSLEIPMLAVFGSADASVPPELNVAPMREALSGNPQGTILIAPGADHFFRVSGPTLDSPVAEMIKWLIAVVGDGEST